MGTGIAWEERFAWHQAGGHPFGAIEPMPVSDLPDGKRRIRNLLEVSGLLDRLTPIPGREATDGEILRAHAPDYLARLKDVDAVGGSVGHYAHIGAGGLSIVRLAAGTAIATIDAVIDRRVENAYAILRPAGHHATRAAGMGFCVVNNVAVAALHALASRGLSRVAIVDIDVHHGNGTQDIFWSDPRVLTISLHQDGLFGEPADDVEAIGEGDGRGTNINVPLPPGSGHGAYIATLEQVVVPALGRFEPDLVIVACGLDASSNDSLGRMNLHSESYREITAILMQAADAHCGGRIAFCHEGGYSLTLVPFLGLAVIETLSGQRTDIGDPFLAAVKRQSWQTLQPHQMGVIMRAAEKVPLVPGR